MIKNVIGLFVFFQLIAFGAQAGDTCSLFYLLQHTNDTFLYKKVSRNDDCLGVLMDSAAIYISSEKNDREGIYYLLSRLSYHSDGGPAEVISYSTYRIFRKDPISLLKYVLKHNDNTLESAIVNELYLDTGPEDGFANKESVINLLTGYKKNWPQGTALLDEMIDQYQKEDCN